MPGVGQMDFLPFFKGLCKKKKKQLYVAHIA